MTSPAPVIHIVDDDPAFGTAIARLLTVSGYCAVKHASADELLSAPFSMDRGCILLDVKMPGVDGLEVQSRLSQSGCYLPIVFLTGHADIATSVRAIKAGAEDFLAKPIAKDRLLDAIGRALVRYDQAHERNGRLKLFRDLVASLTPRQHEVFALLVRGKLNKQIAHEMGTTERTIKAHRHGVMSKLHAKSLAEVVSIAERVGFVTGPEAVTLQA